MSNRPVETTRSAKRPSLKTVLLGVAGVLLCAIAVPVILNAALGALDRRLHPPPGTFLTVDGSRMHLNCTGTGTPTLILESGLGDDFLQWRKIQPALSQLTRVCSYDRAGYGWSEPQPGTRDSIHIADELHALLEQAGISGPIILMGHSAGGLHIRQYATKYPANVVGMVFVDASTPAQVNALPAELVEPDDLRVPEIETVLGIPRIRGRCGQHEWTGMGTVPSDSSQDVDEMEADDCQLSVLRTTSREWNDFRSDCEEVAGTGRFGDVPILIFSEDPQYRPSFWQPARLFPVFSKTWNSLQDGLKGLSTRSRRIIAKRSSHYVQIDRPELVITEVGHFIRSIQGVELPAPENGATKTE